MCSRSQNTAPPSEFAPATLFVPSGWSPPHPPSLPEANFYTRQPCQKFAPISELNCQDGRGSGTLGQNGTKQLYAGTMFDWSGRLLECVRSLFATSLPLLTAVNFCNHTPCPPSPVSLKLCINALCNDTSPMTNNLIAKNYNNNNNNNHILQLIIFSLGER